MSPNVAEGRRFAVLAVDDTPANLDILVELLGQTYDVSVAIDGHEALAYLETNRPDIILLDIMMPGIDGYEVCRRIKENSELEDLPIIFLTAKNESEDIIRGFENGAVDYVSKPFNPSELQARVRAHIELKYSRDLINQKSAEQRELLHILCHDLANPFSNILSVLDVAAGDIKSLTEYTPLLETSARNGLEVIDLVRAMRTIEEKPFELSPIPVKSA